MIVTLSTMTSTGASPTHPRKPGIASSAVFSQLGWACGKVPSSWSCSRVRAGFWLLLHKTPSGVGSTAWAAADRLALFRVRTDSIVITVSVLTADGGVTLSFSPPAWTAPAQRGPRLRARGHRHVVSSVSTMEQGRAGRASAAVLSSVPQLRARTGQHPAQVLLIIVGLLLILRSSCSMSDFAGAARQYLWRRSSSPGERSGERK